MIEFLILYNFNPKFIPNVHKFWPCVFSELIKLKRGAQFTCQTYAQYLLQASLLVTLLPLICLWYAMLSCCRAFILLPIYNCVVFAKILVSQTKLFRWSFEFAARNTVQHSSYVPNGIKVRLDMRYQLFVSKKIYFLGSTLLGDCEGSCTRLQLVL